MSRRQNQIGLICASLMLSASGTWALPECLDDPNAIWSNCVGTYTFSGGFSDGATYVGEWVNNKRNGQGTYTYGPGAWFGDKYDGEFKDDTKHGQGTYTHADGATYVGEWLEGKINGQGVYTYANGASYVGEWLDDKRNGQGTYTSADGTIKQGIWENDRFKYASIAEPPVVSETKPEDDEVRQRRHEEALKATDEMMSELERKCEGYSTIRGVCWSLTQTEMRSVLATRGYRNNPEQPNIFTGPTGANISIKGNFIEFQCGVLNACDLSIRELAARVQNSGLVEGAMEFDSQFSGGLIDGVYSNSNSFCGRGLKGEKICVVESSTTMGFTFTSTYVVLSKGIVGVDISFD